MIEHDSMLVSFIQGRNYIAQAITFLTQKFLPQAPYELRMRDLSLQQTRWLLLLYRTDIHHIELFQ